MHGLHTVDKSQNRNNSRPQTVDNLVDGVDRYASIHCFGIGMNMQKKKQAAKVILVACFAAYGGASMRDRCIRSVLFFLGDFTSSPKKAAKDHAS